LKKAVKDRIQMMVLFILFVAIVVVVSSYGNASNLLWLIGLILAYAIVPWLWKTITRPWRQLSYDSHMTMQSSMMQTLIVTCQKCGKESRYEEISNLDGKKICPRCHERLRLSGNPADEE